MTKFNIALTCSECTQSFRTGELWPPDDRPICTNCLNASAHWHRYSPNSTPAIHRVEYYDLTQWKVSPFGVAQPDRDATWHKTLGAALKECDEILVQRGPQWYVKPEL